MDIYLYDKKTLEYLRTEKAEADPEETKIQGKFVPLLPANSTLIEPPEYKEDEIPVFSGNGWIIYPDFRGKYMAVDKNLNVKEIVSIGVPEGVMIVTRDIGEEILANPEMFKVEEDEIIRKSEEERREEVILERKARFQANFFQTSLGWIRRRVNMKDGSYKDFLSDLVLSVKAGIELGQEVFIITYNEPDYTQEDTTEYMESLQEHKLATIDFVKECLIQIVKDFGK